MDRATRLGVVQVHLQHLELIAHTAHKMRRVGLDHRQTRIFGGQREHAVRTCDDRWVNLNDRHTGIRAIAPTKFGECCSTQPQLSDGKGGLIGIQEQQPRHHLPRVLQHDLIRSATPHRPLYPHRAKVQIADAIGFRQCDRCKLRQLARNNAHVRAARQRASFSSYRMLA